MSKVQLLLVAGTHGNELNAPWLFDQWSKNNDVIKSFGVVTKTVIGNPKARQKCKRYIDRDLNRSFSKHLLESNSIVDYEVTRAKELINNYGPLSKKQPCQLVIDFHSTTANMGSCLVVYGRRKTDLALAALLQYRLGVPIYLHENDSAQTGFLVESWPCGLVIEIGPVAQGLINLESVRKAKIILEICLEEISKIFSGDSKYPEQVIIHRHICSKDYPRDAKGYIDALIQKNIQNRDWYSIFSQNYLFEKVEENQVEKSFDKDAIPVFINEAAYAEKNIAMSFTNKEIWPFESKWKIELNKLIST